MNCQKHRGSADGHAVLLPAFPVILAIGLTSMPSGAQVPQIPGQEPPTSEAPATPESSETTSPAAAPPTGPESHQTTPSETAQPVPVPADTSETAADAGTIPAHQPSTPTENTSDAATSHAEADLENDLAAAAAIEQSGVGAPSLSVYGFADFTLTKFINLERRNANAYFRRWSSFSVGNLNVYLGSDLGANWRSLAEVRFLYLPNGATQWSSTGEWTRSDTTASDYADIYRPLHWGGIEIERVFLEYIPHESIGLRLGQWLSPYGIWNVDHGSPVVISVHRPYVVGEGLIPERQTGVAAFGSVYVKATQFGYHLTLSNGRGPIDTYQDLDGNKAVGWRLFVKNDSLLGSLTLGTSGYRGRYTDSTGTYVQTSGGAYVWQDTVRSQYDELALAADLKWEWNNLLLQGEALLNDTAFDDDARPSAYGVEGPPLLPDYRRWGFYAYLGYRTPWWNTMPYVGGEYYVLGNQNVTVPTVKVYWVGLNIRPTERVVLKLQYKRVANGKPLIDAERIRFNVLEAQAAWSF